MPKNELTAFVGDRYRIELDECWKHEKPEVRNPDRIWYELISCKGGACICLYSLNPPALKLSTSRPKNAREIYEAVRHMPGVKADFHYNGEAEIFFPPTAFHTVAPLAGARKKKRLSPEHKARLAEQGRANLEHYRKANIQTPKTYPIFDDFR
ncbi:MAG: hypothetical protein ACOZFS_04510 [Thermodesulfobacteriota bacterium]